jgi:hypothetical protein
MSIPGRVIILKDPDPKTSERSLRSVLSVGSVADPIPGPVWPIANSALLTPRTLVRRQYFIIEFALTYILWNIQIIRSSFEQNRVDKKFTNRLKKRVWRWTGKFEYINIEIIWITVPGLLLGFLSDWQMKNPPFAIWFPSGMITQYRSPKHSQTFRFKVSSNVAPDSGQAALI